MQKPATMVWQVKLQLFKFIVTKIVIVLDFKIYWKEWSFGNLSFPPRRTNWVYIDFANHVTNGPELPRPETRLTPARLGVGHNGQALKCSVLMKRKKEPRDIRSRKMGNTDSGRCRVPRLLVVNCLVNPLVWSRPPY
jgi:hypothetical protein